MTVVRVPDLRQQVYGQLKEQIRAGSYPSNVRLFEHGVAREFGVSRTPAREALALLAQDGLLVQEGRGFRLPSFTPGEIDDVFEVRLQLEPHAARLAAERAPPERRKVVVDHILRELAKHGEQQSYMDANRRIREALFALCGNTRLINAIRVHEDYTDFVRHRTLLDPATRAISVAGTHRLAEAVKAGDGDGAQAAMTELLTAARRAITD